MGTEYQPGVDPESFRGTTLVTAVKNPAADCNAAPGSVFRMDQFLISQKEKLAQGLELVIVPVVVMMGPIICVPEIE
jgi:hypothetical protein